jgi:hypothetical protein
LQYADRLVFPIEQLKLPSGSPTPTFRKIQLTYRGLQQLSRMVFDLLERRKRKFVLWIPSGELFTPSLVLGTF